MENQRWKFSPIPKIFIHYSKKKSTFKNKRIFTLIEKSTTKLRCGSRSSRNCLRRLRRIYSQFSGEIGWVLKKGMRQLKIELLLKLHQLYFFSPTFLGWLYCTGGMMLCTTIMSQIPRCGPKILFQSCKTWNFFMKGFIFSKCQNLILVILKYLLEKECEISTF